MTKLILIVAMAAGAVTAAPRPAAAAACTDGYMKCLNESYDLAGPLQTMADVECFARYTSCLITALRFW